MFQATPVFRFYFLQGRTGTPLFRGGYSAIPAIVAFRIFAFQDNDQT